MMKKNSTQDKKEELQQAYAEFQMIDTQVKQVRQQVAEIEKHTSDAQETINNLEEMSTTATNTEMLVPVANGVFAKAKLVDSSHMLVNVGGGIVVPKTTADVREMIRTQQAEMQNVADELHAQLELMIREAGKLQEHMKQLVEE